MTNTPLGENTPLQSAVRLKLNQQHTVLIGVLVIKLMMGTLLCCSSATARPLIGHYLADDIAVIDGDSFHANIAIWPDLTSRVTVRLRGIDTPELRGKCAREKRLARKAKQVAQEFLSRGQVIISAVDRGKFSGRVIATVSLETEDITLGDHLLALGLGISYSGGARKNWCL